MAQVTEERLINIHVAIMSIESDILPRTPLVELNASLTPIAIFKGAASRRGGEERKEGTEGEGDGEEWEERGEQREGKGVGRLGKVCLRALLT